MAVERVYKLFPPGIKREQSSLSIKEILCLELYMFTELLFHDIYRMYFNTEGKSDAAIRNSAEKFLKSEDAQNYLLDRSEQIQKLISLDTEFDEKEYLDEKGEFKPEVLKQVKIRAAKELMKPGTENSKAFYMLLDYIIKRSDMTTDGEPPLRVIAEQCRTCRYRIFVEDNYVDLCSICRYQLNSKVKYDHKTQLIEPPKED